MDTASPAPPPLPPSSGRSLRWLAFIICPLVGLFVGLMTALLVTYLAPKEFESKAVLQLSREQAVSAREIVTPGLAERVVEELDLAMRWDLPSGDAVSRVLESVKTEHLRGTDLVEVRVRAADPNDARDIAAALAGGHLRQSREEAAEAGRRAGEILDAEIEEKEREVEKLRIAYAKAEAPLRIAQASDRERKNQAEKERLRIETQLRILDRLKEEQLPKFVAGIGEENQGVVLLINELNQAKRALSALQDSGLGTSHPSHVAAQERVIKLENDLDDAMLVVRVEMGKQLEGLKQEIEELEPGGDGPRVEELQVLLEEYQAGRETLNTMKAQARENRILAKFPRQSVVIHQLPDLARQPVAPKGPGNLLLGSGLGLLVGLMAAFPIALIGRK